MLADPPSAARAPDQKLILIVDDEFDLVSTYELLFQLHGFAVQTATNGREALERARAAPPDIVLSDYMMPVMDGIQLLLAWRADPALRHIPYILNSAGKVLTDMNLPFDAFFTKPTIFPVLLAAIQRLTTAQEK
ncbi:response regulator [Rugamonas sp.]|uniref:response regulator n=1 Tax=Rugamonas sp. TaxID=1926287 RepID=UPI0025D90FFB|nr:response regulator [Rugamonas sp.]